MEVAFSYCKASYQPSKTCDDLPPYYETDPTRGIPNQGVHVQIRVCNSSVQKPRNNPLFEIVRLTLHGALKTEVGRHNALQKVGRDSRAFCGPPIQRIHARNFVVHRLTKI